MAKISIIIPTVNEARTIGETLTALAPARERGHEVLLVDGGSTDGTAALAENGTDRVLSAPRGRARQMNRGAEVARGEVLWFLHADTRPTVEALDALERAVDDGAAWGHFRMRLSGGGLLLGLVGTLINLRTRLTGIASGDQGIFVRRELFDTVDGYADIALMEDIELSSRLGRYASPVLLGPPLVTSSRRWRQRGTWRTIFLMWRLRLSYYLGADPEELARRYY